MKGVIGKSERVLGVSKSYVAILKPLGKGKGKKYEIACDANQAKGDILDIRNIKEVTFEDKVSFFFLSFIILPK